MKWRSCDDQCRAPPDRCRLGHMSQPGEPVVTTDRTLIRRAGANLARGLGGSLPLALLPPLLARRLGGDEFALWVLVVQLASYVSYFEFGIQTAVSKTVATSTASGNLEASRGPVAAGLRLLVSAAFLGLGLALISVAVLPHIFQVPDELRSSGRLMLVFVGVASAVALPGAALHGALLGIGRNGISAIVIVISRLLSVGLTLLGAVWGWPLEALAASLASGVLLNALLPFPVARRAGIVISLSGASSSERAEVRSLTITLGTWTIATLMITGLDVLVVGIVDYEQVAAYGLGASLVVVISAGYSIMFTVLLPAFAESQAQGRRKEAIALVQRSSVVSSWLLAIGFAASIALEPTIATWWAGAYAGDAGPVFLILLCAGVVRLSLSPLAQFIMGAGDHRFARRPAVMEALLNIVLSVALGLAIGARGVAWATLIAAAATMAYYLFWLAPKAIGMAATRQLVVRSYLVPGSVVAVATPLILQRSLLATIAGLVVVGGAGLTTLRVRSMRSATPGGTEQERQTV